MLAVSELVQDQVPICWAKWKPALVLITFAPAMSQLDHWFSVSRLPLTAVQLTSPGFYSPLPSPVEPRGAFRNPLPPTSIPLAAEISPHCAHVNNV